MQKICSRKILNSQHQYTCCQQYRRSISIYFFTDLDWLQNKKKRKNIDTPKPLKRSDRIKYTYTKCNWIATLRDLDYKILVLILLFSFFLHYAICIRFSFFLRFTFQFNLFLTCLQFLGSLLVASVGIETSVIIFFFRITNKHFNIYIVLHPNHRYIFWYLWCTWEIVYEASIFWIDIESQIIYTQIRQKH